VRQHHVEKGLLFRFICRRFVCAYRKTTKMSTTRRPGGARARGTKAFDETQHDQLPVSASGEPIDVLEQHRESGDVELEREDVGQALHQVLLGDRILAIYHLRVGGAAVLAPGWRACSACVARGACSSTGGSTVVEYISSVMPSNWLKRTCATRAETVRGSSSDAWCAAAHQVRANKNPQFQAFALALFTLSDRTLMLHPHLCARTSSARNQGVASS